MIRSGEKPLSPSWELNAQFFVKPWVPFTQGRFVPSLAEIGSVVLEKKIFLNGVSVFSLFRNYLPLEQDMALYLKKLESPSPKDILCHFFFLIRPVVLEKIFFKDLVKIVQKDSFIRNSDTTKSSPIWCPRYWYSYYVFIENRQYLLYFVIFINLIIRSCRKYWTKQNVHVKKWVHKYKWTHVTWPTHNSRSLSERLVYNWVLDPETISNIHLYYLHISWTDIIYKL